MAKFHRKERLWSGWGLHWSFMMLLGGCFATYVLFANTWLLQTQACLRSPYTTVPSIAPNCELCFGGMPETIEDDPIGELDMRLGRWDNSRSYKMFDYAVVGETYADLSKNHKVTIATQSSIDRLDEVLKMAPYWSGAISIAVFVVGEEMSLLRTFAIWLNRCEPELYSRLALHVAMPASQPGILDYDYFWAQNCTMKPQMNGPRKPATVYWKNKNPYPQNHMRNLARKNAQSPYVFLVDIDILVCEGMAEALDDFLDRTPRIACPMCAYVVPTYELDVRIPTVPKDKKSLIKLARKKLAIPFHRKVFIYNQFASNFSLWESTGGNESELTHISHNVTNFELLYEPFYIAPDSVPPHDERFVGYGFTRNTQCVTFWLWYKNSINKYAICFPHHCIYMLAVISS